MSTPALNETNVAAQELATKPKRSGWRVLRCVKIWQRDGTTTQANAALWALTATALIMVLPVLLALILPQHPAP